MRRLLTLVSCLLVLGPLSGQAAQAADPGSFVGAWKNQLGSYLVIEGVAPNGAVTGFYVNQAPRTGCQGSPYPLAGWAYSTTITFAVLWNNSVANCNSQTAWTGLLSGNQITTNWNLVTTNGQWQRGQDVFTPVQVEVLPSLLLEAKP